MPNTEAKVEGNTRDINNLKERVDRFEDTCSGHRQELKELIEKALENELAHLKEEVSEISERLTANGFPKRKGVFERLKSVDTIINAVIAGVVAIIAAAITSGWRP